MKKIFKILLIFITVTAVIFWSANQYLEAKLLNNIKQNLGDGSNIEELNLSLLENLSLKGISVNNANHQLTADELKISYQLAPLLQQRLALTQLSVNNPVITINHNKVKAAVNHKTANNQLTAFNLNKAKFEVSLAQIKINQGKILINDELNNHLIKIDDVNFVSDKVEYNNGILNGNGKIDIEQLTVADKLLIKKIASPISYDKQILCDAITGKLAGGELTGNLLINAIDKFDYSVNLHIKDIDATTLLQEANIKPVVNGKLQITTKLNGNTNLANLNGDGQAAIINGQIHELPLLELLATLLQMHELRSLSFNEMKIEFAIANNEIQTPVIKILSPNLYISGKGVLSLTDKNLNHDFTLAFSPELIKNLPSQMRNIFVQQPDGFLAINFHVAGLYSAPKTDLAEKLAKGTVNQLLNQGLKGLFKR